MNEYAWWQIVLMVGAGWALVALLAAAFFCAIARWGKGDEQDEHESNPGVGA